MFANKVNLRNIKSLLSGAKVIMRVDFNVPLNKKLQILDKNRIKQTIPTIKYILAQNPKSLVLMSHLGRPNGKRNMDLSLKPCQQALKKLLGIPVSFLSDCIGKKVEEKCTTAKKGEVILLENLRFHPEETLTGDKEKDQIFQKKLSQYGDIYINDAFGTSHRAHSSVVGINAKINAAGLLVEKEMKYFSSAIEKPKRPLLVILGGSKIGDKIQLIDKMLDIVDEMVIGGGMAATFLRTLYGMNIGNSLYDEYGAKMVPKIMMKARKNQVKLEVPIDFICGNKFSENCQTRQFTLQSGIPNGWAMYDIGINTRRLFKEAIRRSSTIIWNGPMGVFEWQKFRPGSQAILDALIHQKHKNATTIIGGGDSGSFVKSQKAEGKVSHVSTGGGASLEMLEGKLLPGIENLTDISTLRKLNNTY